MLKALLGGRKRAGMQAGLRVGRALRLGAALALGIGVGVGTGSGVGSGAPPAAIAAPSLRVPAGGPKSAPALSPAPAPAPPPVVLFPGAGGPGAAVDKGKKRQRAVSASASPKGPLGMQAFVGLSAQLGPAVVSILAQKVEGEDDKRRRSREQGSGVIVNPAGYILTNNHVVDSAYDLKVVLEGDIELPARLVGRDERTDIALIKIDAGPRPLKWAQLGDSDALHIGEWVMAIGSPFGLDHSVTVGIVSAKGRREVQPGGGHGYFDFIQTDASINPGNSGGPLINARGEVIGINTAVNVAGSGIGFAIPSNIARRIAEQIHRRGRVVRSWLGVFPQPVTETLRQAFKLPDRHGALLAEVYEGSPAAAAGLLPGDVIIDLDGRSVQRADDLLWFLGMSDRRRLTVRYLRGGLAQKTEVTLPEPETPPTPPPGTEAATTATAAARPSALGITVSELTPAMARQLGYDEPRGLVIMTVEPSSPALDAGVERGDVILRVGDRPVGSLAEYATAMKAIAPGQMIRLLVRREERKQWHNMWLAFARR